MNPRTNDQERRFCVLATTLEACRCQQPDTHPFTWTKISKALLFHPIYNRALSATPAPTKAADVFSNTTHAFEVLNVDEHSSNGSTTKRKKVAINDPRRAVFNHNSRRRFRAVTPTVFNNAKNEMAIYTTCDVLLGIPPFAHSLLFLGRSNRVIGYRRPPIHGLLRLLFGHKTYRRVSSLCDLQIPRVGVSSTRSKYGTFAPMHENTAKVFINDNFLFKTNPFSFGLVDVSKRSPLRAQQAENVRIRLEPTENFTKTIHYWPKTNITGVR